MCTWQSNTTRHSREVNAAAANHRITSVNRQVGRQGCEEETVSLGSLVDCYLIIHNPGQPKPLGSPVVRRIVVCP